MTEQTYEPNRDYLPNLDLLLSAIRVINALPIQQMLSTCQVNATLAQVLEPTAYMRGGSQSLRDQERILRACLAVQEASSTVLVEHHVDGTCRNPSCPDKVCPACGGVGRPMLTAPGHRHGRYVCRMAGCRHCPVGLYGPGQDITNVKDTWQTFIHNTENTP